MQEMRVDLEEKLEHWRKIIADLEKERATGATKARA